MKKNLNIAYLNDTEGVRRCSALSDNGSDVKTNAEYYRIDWDKAIELGYVNDTTTEKAA